MNGENAPAGSRRGPRSHGDSTVKFALASKHNFYARLINPRMIQEAIDGLKERKGIAVQVKLAGENNS